MKFRMLALLGLLVLAWTEPAFAQLPPPQPVGAAALEGQTKITASTSSSRVALPSTEPNAKAVTIYNSGSTDVYFVLGNSSVTATSSNTLIKAGTYLTVWRDTNTHLAAISASSTDDLIIYQGNGVLQFGQVGGGSGGGGSGTVTNVATGNGLTGGPITTTGTISATEVLGNGGAAVTATTYHASPTNDAARQLLFTGTSASAWDDAGTGTTAAGLGFDIVNAGTANVTYTPAAGIDGTVSLVVPFGSWAHVFFDGTTWRSEPGKNLSGVTAGTYGDSTHCVAITVDKYGRLTSASQSTSCPGAATPNYVSGRIYALKKVPMATGLNGGATTIHWQRVHIPSAVTFSNWTTRITTGSAGNLYLACADNTGTNGGPGTILGSMTSGGGGIVTTSTGLISKAMTCAFSAPGDYWIGAIMDNATAVAWSNSTAMSEELVDYGVTNVNQAGGSGTTVAPDFQTTGATPGTWSNNPTVTPATGPTATANPFLLATVQ